MSSDYHFKSEESAFRTMYFFKITGPIKITIKDKEYIYENKKLIPLNDDKVSEITSSLSSIKL